ncbi:MAG: DUF2993 domain-containing protein [Elainellaceae cyanobacterium]
MSANETNLGEQALGKVAEVAIASQLDQAEQINVEIHTDPLKLVQGKLDSAAITGEGMVMNRELRVEAIEAHTDSINIDPMKAIAGQVELTQPTNAHAQILLTEPDLNRALSSDYIRGKMQGLSVEIEGKPTLIDIDHAKIHLQEGELALDMTLLQRDNNETKQLSAVAKPFLKDQGQRLDLEIVSAEGQHLTLEFATALFKKVMELLDLRKFELEGMRLTLNDISVREGKLLLRATSLVEKLPTA